MAAGHPDYRKNVDIAQQSLAALNANVDIVAQTLALMNIDIVAQTLAALKVDIDAQSIGNLDVDINAQSIGNVAMNIAGQSLAEVTQRNKYGAIQWALSAYAFTGVEDKLLFSVAGKGVIYGIYISNITAVEPNTDYDHMLIDGTDVSSLVFGAIKYLGDITVTPAISRPTLWDRSTGTYIFFRGSGLTFETSFALYYDRTYADNAAVVARVYYALV